LPRLIAWRLLQASYMLIHKVLHMSCDGLHLFRVISRARHIDGNRSGATPGKQLLTDAGPSVNAALCQQRHLACLASCVHTEAVNRRGISALLCEVDLHLHWLGR
jgi:hypothetical protein